MCIRCRYICLESGTILPCILGHPTDYSGFTAVSTPMTRNHDSRSSAQISVCVTFLTEERWRLAPRFDSSWTGIHESVKTEAKTARSQPSVSRSCQEQASPHLKLWWSHSWVIFSTFSDNVFMFVGIVNTREVVNFSVVSRYTLLIFSRFSDLSYSTIYFVYWFAIYSNGWIVSLKFLLNIQRG